MKTSISISDFKEALKNAQNLPQDSSTPIYQLFDEKVSFTTIYANDPISVFNSMFRGRMNSNYYIKVIDKMPTLMYHKKYSRNDIPVKNVEFKIVGLKRRSTHLDAGVLISDIKFIV